MRIGTRNAADLRAGILDAHKHGWRRPPKMWNDAGRVRYECPLYGRAWRRTMEKLGQYPPSPPRGKSGGSQ